MLNNNEYYDFNDLDYYRCYNRYNIDSNSTKNTWDLGLI